MQYPLGEAGLTFFAELREALLTIRPGADIELIERACDVASHCHEGQKRRSGDPYITHPIAVARILAGLGHADDQTLCAAILHDTVEDTAYTVAELRHDFGAAIANMVVGHMALDQLRIRQGRSVYQVTEAITSTDTRIVALKMADRLHNMQTLRFLPQEKQLRKAREVLDIFLPVAEQLSMHSVRSELQALAFEALIRNRPARPPRHRTMVALDIESSTTRPDSVKAELRTMLYELFDAALRSAGLRPLRRGQFFDRGDGLLALFRPADQALLLNRVVPVLSRLLASYNASLPDPSRSRRQLRVRAVVHAGEVGYDDNGCFGEALDIAFRLLDAPRAKAALKAAHGPLQLVVSGDIYTSVIRHGRDGLDQAAFRRVISAPVAGTRHPGWVHIPAQSAWQVGACTTAGAAISNRG